MSLAKELTNKSILKQKIEWVFLAIVTLLIGLTVKFWTENSKLKDAVEFEYNKKTEEIRSDSSVKQMQSDYKKLTDKVDSLIKMRSRKGK